MYFPRSRTQRTHVFFIGFSFRCCFMGWKKTHAMFKRKLGYRKQAHTCRRASFISHCYIMMCDYFSSIFAHFKYLFNFSILLANGNDDGAIHADAPMHCKSFCDSFPKQTPLINALRAWRQLHLHMNRTTCGAAGRTTFTITIDLIEEIEYQLNGNSLARFALPHLSPKHTCTRNSTHPAHEFRLYICIKPQRSCKILRSNQRYSLGLRPIFRASIQPIHVNNRNYDLWLRKMFWHKTLQRVAFRLRHSEWWSMRRERQLLQTNSYKIEEPD